ncbi:MAG: hypothetical protein Q9168_004013, partial [Polycauliona sp. 1 TL-2023]
MGSNKKRKHSRISKDSPKEDGNTTRKKSGVAAALARAKKPDGQDQNHENHDTAHEAAEDEEEEWTVVGKGGKKRKTNNYPALVYADAYKQQSSIKLADLQNLVLYCVASGTSPQWVAVRHHGQINKAVVLFVPGLERAMFDGSVALSESPQKDPLVGNGLHHSQEDSQTPSNVPSNIAVTQSDGPSPTNASPDDYLPVRLAAENLPEPLKPLADCFEHLWPVRAPGDDKFAKVYSPLHHMLNSPVPRSQDQKAAEKAVKGAKPINDQKWESKRTPITSFIASKDDLQENDYVVHPIWLGTEHERETEIKRRVDAGQTAESGWMDTLVADLTAADNFNASLEQGSLTAGRTVLAMDCEMCTVQGGEAALTRISLVNWDGDVIMDELVKPGKPIIDYLTRFSGITPEKMNPITTSLPDIQTRLLSILTPTTILLGHSLNSDLEALKLTHPFIIDTSLLYPHPRGPPLKSSLKWLAQKYLQREIQKGHGSLGHDSIEDSRACLDLVKKKCEKGPEYGSIASNSETIFKRLARTPRKGPRDSSSLVGNGEGGAATPHQGKTGAIIDHGSPEKNFGQMATYSLSCNSDAEIVSAVHRSVNGDPDGATIPGCGVDFTWARMRELESVRGWSNNYRYDLVRIDNNDNNNNNNPPTLPSSSATANNNNENTTPNHPSPTLLAQTLTTTVSHIKQIHTSLPPCTLFIVYTGTGDPRPLARLQEMQRTFKREYKTKKWDELSVKWTDVEEQGLKAACKRAREGVGFV